MKTSALLSLGAALLLSACGSVRQNRFPPAPAAGASPVARDNCDSRDRTATLIGRLQMTFKGAARGEAVVRIVGESYDSTIRIDVATGSSFELREDSYRVRVTVDGYRAVEETVKVVCGKDVPLAITLNRR
ncbi:MAG: hypothetical protein IBJ03_04755 [Gemmatimonadaceae bacterium]|nr:hypothetical protein [Gemmatimonadaceae bacterium]